MSYIYIASPYTHGKREIVNARHLLALHYTALLFGQKKLCFSPIVHCHPVAQYAGLPGDFQFWEQYNRAMIDGCDALHVLELPGWEISQGVQAEIRIAKFVYIPVINISFKELFKSIPVYEEGEGDHSAMIAYKLLAGTIEQ